MAASTIICPNCNTSFEPTDAIREEIQKELRLKAAEWQKEQNEKFKLKENALLKQLQDKDQEFEKSFRKKSRNCKQNCSYRCAKASPPILKTS